MNTKTLNIMPDKDNEKDLGTNLDNFLGDDSANLPQQDCVGEECLIKTDKSLVEKINKKHITEDGRQLLF